MANILGRATSLLVSPRGKLKSSAHAHTLLFCHGVLKRGQKWNKQGSGEKEKEMEGRVAGCRRSRRKREKKTELKVGSKKCGGRRRRLRMKEDWEREVKEKNNLVI